MLGGSGLEVSAIGLGLAALGRPAYVNLGHGTDLGSDRSVDALRDRCHRILDLAWELNVRYVDAARSYGLAEEFLASWLAGRSSVPVVGSKWGYEYTAGWQTQADHHEMKDHSLAVFRRQLEESRTLLGEHLRLYQIHSVTNDSPVLDDKAVLGELTKLRDSGTAIGVTVSGPEQPEIICRASAVTIDGEPLFSSIQATWNLLEPSAGPALEEAHKAGLGVIVKEALANGRLAGRAGAGVPGPDKSGSGTSGTGGSGPVLAHAAAAMGTSTDSLAIAAALHQRFADVVLSGAATPDQLRSNVRAVGLSLDAELISELVSTTSEKPELYWRKRRALPWN